MEKERKMATVPRGVRLSVDESCDDIFLIRSSPKMTSSDSNNQIRSFTTEDIPTTRSMIPPPPRSNNVGPDMFVSSSSLLSNNMNGITTDRITKISAAIVDTVKKKFTLDEIEKDLRADWVLVESEELQITELKTVVEKLTKAFLFAKASELGTFATNVLQRCEDIIERSIAHTDTCSMAFSECSNELMTVQDYMKKLNAAFTNSSQTTISGPTKVDDKRNDKKAEWALSRMLQSLQTMVTDFQNSVNEIDDISSECMKLMVDTITLLHLREQSADFSGTGVAAGAAGVVTGAVVGVAGIIAAPATGGLSVPISIAGKGLFLSGIAALAPAGLILKSQSQQLSGLVKLLEQLKSRLEIMTEKREEMAKSLAVCIDAEMLVDQATTFCKDAMVLGSSAFESAGLFINPIQEKIEELEKLIAPFQESPTCWHYCRPEHLFNQYLAPEEDEE